MFIHACLVSAIVTPPILMAVDMFEVDLHLQFAFHRLNCPDDVIMCKGWIGGVVMLGLLQC